MKRHHGVRSWKKPVITWLFSLMTLSCLAGAALAVGFPSAQFNVQNCADCHSLPPKDSPDGNRYASTGAVKGSHQAHLADQGAPPSTSKCDTCHSGSASYTMAYPTHQNRYIEMRGNINISNLQGRYSTATFSKLTTFTQRSNPVTGSCANVNCHFEKGTDTWGTAKYAAASAITCNKCHDDTAAASTNIYKKGAHLKHYTYYNKTNDPSLATSCSYCHPNHAAETNKFAHATSASAGHRIIDVKFSGLAGTIGTASNGGRAYPYFLPSNTPDANNTTCSAIYCHSAGRASETRYTIPTWNVTNGNGCLWCHGGRTAGGVYSKSTPSAFSLSTTHSQHLGKYPAANMNCQICHSKTADRTTPNTALKNYTGVIYHANGTRNVTFTDIAYGSYTAYKDPSSGSGGTTKKCANISCHGGITRAAWSTNTINNDNTCVHCHGVVGTTPGNTDKRNYAPGWKKLGTDTDQSTSRQDYQVGAHFKHLSSAIMKPIKCNECHKVPNNPFDAGHMAQPRFTVSATLLFDQASTAKWNGVTQTTLASFSGYTSGTATKAATCSSVYCHGNRLKNGDTGGAVNVTYRKPYWNYSGLINSTPSATTCGRCHGAPPSSVSASHNGKVFPNDCTTCHGSVVDATGKIINKALHINGKVDAAGCTSCHGNPPRSIATLVTTVPTYALGNPPTVFGAHSTHYNKRQIQCTACHNGNSPTMTGVSIDMGFVIDNTTWLNQGFTASTIAFGTFTGNAPTGGVLAASSNAGTIVRTVANNTRNSCNVYCHGGWTGSNGSKRFSWIDGLGTATCGTCHGTIAAKAPTAGSHGKHASNNATASPYNGGYSITCTTCHNSRATGDVSHITGSVQWRFSSGVRGLTNVAQYTRAGATGSGTFQGATNAPAGSGTYGSCSSIYCHSTGRSTPQYNSQTWGNGTTTCLSCHGGRDGAGAAAKSALGFGLSTTHYQHFKYPVANMNCNICHGKTAANQTTLKQYSGVIYHVNGAKTVVFTSPVYGSYTAYKATKKCGNVSCHGGISRNAWTENGAINSNNTCVHCHGVNGTSTLVANAGDSRKFFAPGWNKQGTDTDQKTSRNALKTGAHFLHLSSVFMKKIKCNECHSVPSSPFTAGHMDQPRYNSTTLTFGQASSAKWDGAALTNLASFSGYTAGTAIKAATCSSVYCHGNRLKNGGTNGSYRKPMWNYSGLINATPSATTCGRCHGAPPDSVTSSHNGVTLLSQCSGCHGKVVNSTGTIISKALHINGTVDSSVNCLGCHSTAKTGGVYNPRRVDTDFTLASRHVFSRTVNSFDCVVCHLEGDQTKSDISNGANAIATFTGTTWHNEGASTADRFVNLRNVDTVTTGFQWTRYGTTATHYKNMDDFCMKCHDGNGATGIVSYAATLGSAPTGTQSVAGGSAAPSAVQALNPFSESLAATRASGPSNSLVRARITNVFSQFSTAWKWPAGDGTLPTGFTAANYAGNASHHAVRGPRYYANNASWGTAAWTSNVLKSGQNINTVREKAQLHCADCHSSDTNGHGSATIFMLADKTAVTGWVSGIASATSPVDKLCWGCHSGNVYGTTVTAGSRWNHAGQDAGHTFSLSYSSNVTGNCRLCHGGGSGDATDVDGTVSTKYGAIHGANGKTAAPAASVVTRYRFIGGSTMTPSPAADTGWSTTGSNTCYGSATNWSNCSKHNAASGTGYAYSYGRPTTY